MSRCAQRSKGDEDSGAKSDRRQSLAKAQNEALPLFRAPLRPFCEFRHKSPRFVALTRLATLEKRNRSDNFLLQPKSILVT